MPANKSYTISELARTAEVTTRTIRYYVAEELLPPPEGSGRSASYGQEHLARLELIKILKDEYLPLQEIRTLLSGLDYQAVVELLEQKQKINTPPPAPNSAKEYLQTLLSPSGSGEFGFIRHEVERRSQVEQEVQETRKENHEMDTLPSAPTSQMTTQRAATLREAAEPVATNRAVGRADNLQAKSVEGTASPAQAVSPFSPGRAEATPTSTHWRRIELAPGVELHLQEGLEHSNLWQKIEWLIEASRQILK